MSTSPMHQFEITVLHPLTLGGWELHITNQALWTGIAVALVCFVFLWGVRSVQLVPGRTQAFVEMTYEFIHKLVKDNAGAAGLVFFPYILTLFVFIAALNLIGMVPGSYTATSQISTTAFMAFVCFGVVLVTALARQGLAFFAHFYPPGVPLILAPLIVPLEMISFFIRPFTLAMRLAINMVAGHLLLKLFAAFIIMMLGLSWLSVAGILPLFVLIAITALEVFVALLQAYIFTVLTCVYLGEVLRDHHGEGHNAH